MPRLIALNKGSFTLVDDEDYERLLFFEWKLSSKKYAVSYAKRPDRHKTYLYLHRFLMNATDRAIQVDHIDSNRLNNTRANLRFATRSQNQWNKGVAENNTTGFKGVSRLDGKFSAGLKWHGRHIHIAFVDSPILAAQLYDVFARLLFGEFARTNFQGVAPTTPEVEFYIAKTLARLRKSGIYSTPEDG